MKLNESQLYVALNEYINQELMPLGASMNLTDQFLFGFKMGIAKRKLQDVIKAYLKDDKLKMFGLVDENGYIDVDVIYESASDMMNQMQQVEIAGITFKPNDVQKLYGIMQRHATQNQHPVNSI